MGLAAGVAMGSGAVSKVMPHMSMECPALEVES
jgi:hypothetical protein